MSSYEYNFAKTTDDETELTTGPDTPPAIIQVSIISFFYSYYFIETA